jgi:hypothetical protein
MKEEVKVSKKRFIELLEHELKLEALEAAGVDNWEGFDSAMEIYYDLRSEEKF